MIETIEKLTDNIVKSTVVREYNKEQIMDKIQMFDAKIQKIEGQKKPWQDKLDLL